MCARVGFFTRDLTVEGGDSRAHRSICTSGSELYRSSRTASAHGGRRKGTADRGRCRGGRRRRSARVRGGRAASGGSNARWLVGLAMGDAVGLEQRQATTAPPNQPAAGRWPAAARSAPLSPRPGQPITAADHEGGPGRGVGGGEALETTARLPTGPWPVAVEDDHRLVDRGSGGGAPEAGPAATEPGPPGRGRAAGRPPGPPSPPPPPGPAPLAVPQDDAAVADRRHPLAEAGPAARPWRAPDSRGPRR